MPEDYIVKAGDCVGSVAFEHGFFWETVWNHAQNAALKDQRKNPNVLLPGDTVHIPDLRLKEESGATEKRHRFRLKGVPAKFHVRLMNDDEPRADVEYELEVEGKRFSGKTNPNGEVIQAIPPNARKGRLRVKCGDKWEEYALRLGFLDPADNITGVQARLRNLGCDLGDESGAIGPLTEAALRWFQNRAGCKETGRLDQATIDALTKQHDAGEPASGGAAENAPAGGKQWEAPDLTATRETVDMLDAVEDQEPATAPDWEDQPEEDDQPS